MKIGDDRRALVSARRGHPVDHQLAPSRVAARKQSSLSAELAKLGA
jgi:hypothetical protein